MNPASTTTPSAVRCERAARVVRRLREQSYQAYFVGGCVRDLLLEREPADYDVDTDALPDATQLSVEFLYRNYIIR